MQLHAAPAAGARGHGMCGLVVKMWTGTVTSSSLLLKFRDRDRDLDHDIYAHVHACIHCCTTDASVARRRTCGVCVFEYPRMQLALAAHTQS
jgi:hypothetical protein